MVALEAWSPAQRATDEEVEDSPELLAPEVANLLEACSHLAHIPGYRELKIDGPTPEMVEWAIGRGAIHRRNPAVVGHCPAFDVYRVTVHDIDLVFFQAVGT